MIMRNEMQSTSRSLKADLRRSREFPVSWIVLTLFRAGQRCQRNPILRPMYAFANVVLLQILFGVELPPSVECGPGLRLAHGGRGLVVSANAKIGSNVTLYHGVTIGVRGTTGDAPIIEDGAYIGAGACILGAIRIGAESRVGANAVVLADVPRKCTAVGVPASVVSTAS
jgi:serine acetyltransferase